MKPLAQHVKESFNDSSKKVPNEKTVEEELDALNRTAPAEKVPIADSSSLVDKTIGGK